VRSGTYASCQFRTHALRQKPDHFVGGNLQRERNSQAKRLRDLEVDYQFRFEHRGLYHGQICELRAAAAHRPTCRQAAGLIMSCMT
jgi:hypothetical protein